MARTSLPGTTDRRLASLLTLFANNATIAISGEHIAKEIGVSRSTVWRWVERLRELGVKVKGQAATGYFLEKVPDEQWLLLPLPSETYHPLNYYRKHRQQLLVKLFENFEPP